MEDAALRWAALSDWRGWPGSGGPGRPERMGGVLGFGPDRLTARLPCAGGAGDRLPPPARSSRPRYGAALNLTATASDTWLGSTETHKQRRS